jgi:aryl-alcohol dehydrogenase-like predicted oxidoreductase
MFLGPAGPTPVNTARFLFLDSRAREFYLDWDRAARNAVAVLRSTAGRNPHDRALSDLVGELSIQSSDFRTQWAAHNVRFQLNGLKRFHHPVVGELSLNFERLDLAADAGLTLFTYTADPRLTRRRSPQAPRQLGGDGLQSQRRASGRHDLTPAPGKTALDKRKLMEHRLLGRTGVSVSKMCLGAMMFGSWGNPDHDDSIRIIHAALDAGINFLDTADVYGAGESEEIVGKALKGRRDDVVLATKFFNPMGDDPNRRGGSRRWIIQAVEESLRRLQTDWIDLYQVHRIDPLTNIDETLSALTDLVHQGKVRYIGHSTFPASQIVDAQWTARERGLQRFISEQPPYSILVRAVEADVLPTCQRHGMGVLSYSPLTGGWLSGRWRKTAGQQGSSRANRLPERFDLSQPGNQRKLDAVEELAQLAEETGVTLIQLAIAFVLNHPAITSALIGPRTMEQFDGQLAAAQVTLDQAVLDRIDEIVAPGVTVNPVDNSFANPALEPAARRR